MVAFRAISSALAVAAVTAPFGALANNVDFGDNNVKPGYIQPLTRSHGYNFEHFDLLGGAIDTTGNIAEDVLATLGGGRSWNNWNGWSNGWNPKGHNYGHGVGIVGGLDDHYHQPSRIYHPTGKNFNIWSLKALCCAADLSKRCHILDCHIKLSGYNKHSGGKKVYDHDFYVPKSYNGRNKDVNPIDIDIKKDGIVNYGRPGMDLAAIVIDIELFDIADIKGNDQKRRGRYSYKPSHQRGVVGLGLVVDIDLDLKL
ncbi:hypothetical protein ABW21_db0206136 [Orbilia brochopaga]|nr:hypothetical protein ABW21_db0206136 [Drechslerella brochopaga]